MFSKIRLDTVVNVAILLVIMVLLLGPTGPVGRWFIGWRASNEERELIESLWHEMITQATIISKDANPQDTIVMFTDYQCPFCRSIEPAMQKAVANGVAIAILHLPLEQIHPKAREAASVAICAANYDQFERVHHALMETEYWFEGGDWEAFVGMHGISDTRAFTACMESEATTKRVTANVALANRLGITGTPSFVTRAGIQMGVEGLDETLPRVDTTTLQTSYKIDDVLFESTTSRHAGVSMIGKLSGGLMLSRNLIVLADAMAKSLFFVDIGSGEVKIVGRQGKGPGEFQMIRSIGRTASGDVFIDDPPGTRVTMFDADGFLIETVSYNPVDFRGFVWIPQPIGVHADGTVIFRDSDPLFTERPDGPYREKIDYLALQPDGERVRIAEADGRELVRRNYPDSRYTAFEKPFSYSAIDAVAGNLVIVGDTESGVLSAYDRSGDIVVEFDYGRGVEISSEHDRLWRERKVAQLRQEELPKIPEGTPANLAGLFGGIGATGDDEAEFYRTADANPTAPSFSRMFVDGEGRMWMQRYVLPGEDEAKWSRWHLDEDWDRMEAVVLPGAHELLDALDERILLRTTDELGVERAVVATLKRVSPS